MDVIIAIGYDGADSPLGFLGAVSSIIRRLGTLNASINGQSHSPGWGTEDATWLAASFPDFDTYAEARARILAVGAVENQDAIAFTVGTTDVAPCPKPDPKPYRDFL